MKRIIAMILAVMLLVGCSASTDEVDEVLAPASSEKVSGNQSGLEYEIVEEVVEFPLEDGTVYYKNEIKYPHFKGDSEIEKTLNSKYDEQLQKFKDNSTDYDELYSSLTSQGVDVDSNLPYYDNVIVDVTYNKKGVVSLKEVNVSWSGSAHPYHNVNGYTYKITDGTQLNYSHIIKGDENEIDKVLKHYFTEYQGKCTDTDLDKLKNDTPYTLCEDGLCFYYWVGDAVDRVEIIIPFTGNDYTISATSIIEEFEDSEDETVSETKSEKTAETKSSEKKTSNSSSTSEVSYKKVINEAIKEATAYSEYEDGQGVLYDVDGNGVDELIMIFNSLNGTSPYDGQTVPAALYSVYTISNNKVVPLIEKEQLFTLAGGPSGEVYLMNNGAETLLGFMYSEINPGGNNELYKYGDWHIYKVNGNKADKVKTVNYSILDVRNDNGNTYSIKYDESTATINNSKKSYKEFEQWLESYDSTLLFRSYGRDDSTSLETLLNKIQ